MPDSLAEIGANINTSELFFKFIPKFPTTSNNIKSTDDIVSAVGPEGTGNASRISYANQFNRELANFNDGYKVKNVIENDVVLV